MIARYLIALLSLLAATAAASPAAGQDMADATSDDARERARERFVRGIERLEAKDYAGAVGEFQRAYDIAPYAVIRFNLGIAYAKLGRPVKAFEALEAVLAKPGSLSAQRIAQAKETIAAQRRQVGTLAIAVDAEGATLRVDGVEIGEAPLVQPVSLRAGLHFVEAVKAGYAPARKEVSVAGESQASVSLSLQTHAAGLAQLWIKSDLPGADVFLDSQRIGRTPLKSSVPVVPGEHRVELRRLGYDRAADLVTVGPGATAELRLEPRPDRKAIQRKRSALTLTGEAPESLVVTVNGERIGPYGGPIPLAPGPHELRVERAGFLPRETRVVVPDGDTLAFEVRLEPTVETIADHDATVQSYRIAAWTTLVGGVALAGAGAGFTAWNEITRSDDLDTLEAEVASGRCDRVNPGFDDDFCVPLAEGIDDAAARRPAGYVMIGVGGALLITGITLFAVMPDPDRYRPEVDEPLARIEWSPVLSAGPGGAYVGAAARF